MNCMKYSFATPMGALVLLTSLAFTVPVFASSSSATFSGTGSAHIVAKVVSSGRILNLEIPTSFTVTVTPGGSGVATLALTIVLHTSEGDVTRMVDGGANDLVGTGQITVTSTSAAGGGTLNNNPSSDYMSQFGFGVTSQNGQVAGQFQCQNTGRSASVMDVPVSGVLGLPVDVLQMAVHRTVTTFTTS